MEFSASLDEIAAATAAIEKSVSRGDEDQAAREGGALWVRESDTARECARGRKALQEVRLGLEARHTSIREHAGVLFVFNVGVNECISRNSR